MNKKLLQLMLAASVCTFLFCGCQKKDTDGKIEIEFIHWGGDSTYSGCYKDRIAMFEKENPDIKVKVTTVASDYDTKVQTMFVGKNAPDVLQVQPSSCTTFAEKGVLEDLSGPVKESDLDLEETFGGGMDGYETDEGIYALPDRGGTTITYYNKDMFDEAGISYPDKDWTMDDYMKACERLTKDTDGDGETDQWGAASTDYLGTCGPLILSYGANIVNEDYEIGVDSTQMKEFMEDYNKCYQNGWIIPYEELEKSGSNGDNFFAQQRCAMILTGFWNVESYTKMDELNFDIAPTPTQETPAAWAMGSALSINKQSTPEKKEAAWRFIQFMTGEEGQNMLAKTLADCPANLKVLGSDTFVNQEVNGKKLSLDVIGLEQSRVKVDGISKGAYSSELTGELQSRIKEMLLGRETVDEALRNMDGKLKKLIKYYK